MKQQYQVLIEEEKTTLRTILKNVGGVEYVEQILFNVDGKIEHDMDKILTKGQQVSIIPAVMSG